MYIVAKSLQQAKSDDVIAVQTPDLSLDDMHTIALMENGEVFEMKEDGEIINVQL